MVFPVSNGYANHLHEELAMFKIEDFATQTYVQPKCHLRAKRYCVVSSRMSDSCYSLQENRQTTTLFMNTIYVVKDHNDY